MKIPKILTLLLITTTILSTQSTNETPESMIICSEFTRTSATQCDITEDIKLIADFEFSFKNRDPNFTFSCTNASITSDFEFKIERRVQNTVMSLTNCHFRAKTLVIDLGFEDSDIKLVKSTLTSDYSSDF